MNKLSPDQLATVAHHIRQTKPHQALQAELLDHIASQIEQRMDQGGDFSAAFEQVMQQANPQALDWLKHTYIREFMTSTTIASLRTSRVAIRSRQRREARPFQYIYLSSVFTLLLVMGFLVVVSRPLAIPMDAFRTAWGAVGVAGILILRWWLSRRLRKPKRLLTI